MHVLKCPYCDQKASSFFKTYFWGYFPGNQPNRCNNCSRPIKYKISGYLQCGLLFLILLFILGRIVDPIFAFFERKVDPNAIVEKAPAIDVFGFAEHIFEIGFVLFILYISFELPGKYLGIRIFKKRI